MMKNRPTNLRLSVKLALAALLLGVLAACGGEPPVVTVERTLTVAVDGTGSGTVTSDVGGIDVATGDAAVSVDLEEGTEVELTAVAEAGSTFTGWTGGGCTGTAACVVVLDADTSVTATFTENIVVAPQPLTVTIVGAGVGTVTSDVGGIDMTSGDAPVVVDIDGGVDVTLTATAGVDSVFAGWSGACSGVGTCTVTMDAAASVTADFVLESGAVPADYVIATSSDDAEEYEADINVAFPTGSVHTNSGDLDLGRSESLNSGVVVGLRYAGVDIPQGAIILSASITFTRSAASGTEAVTFTIAGQDADDSDTFVYGGAGNEATFGITSRPTTSATVAWFSDAPWGATATSPDLASIVQEIVDRDGWAANNALVFVIDSDDETPGASRRAVSADTLGGTAPVLSVSYVLPTAP